MITQAGEDTEATDTSDDQSVTSGDGDGLLTDVVDLVGSGVETITGFGSGIGDIISGLGDALTANFFEAIGRALTEAAISANRLVLESIANGTTVDLGRVNRSPSFWLTMSLGLVLVLLLFIVAVLGEMKRGNPAGVLRAAAVDVPRAIGFTPLVLAVAELIIAALDEATIWLIGEASESLGTAFTSPEAFLVSNFISGVMVAVYVAAALLTWMWLELREALIYLLALTAPITIATIAWEPTRRYARKGADIAVALIVSAFVLALALAFGAEQFLVGIDNNEFGVSLDGLVIMVLAAFMPAVVYQAIPFVSDAASFVSASRAPLRVVATVAGIGLAARGLGAGGGTPPPPPPPPSAPPPPPSGSPPSSTSGGSGPGLPPAAAGSGSGAGLPSGPGGGPSTLPSGQAETPRLPSGAVAVSAALPSGATPFPQLPAVPGPAPTGSPVAPLGVWVVSAGSTETPRLPASPPRSRMVPTGSFGDLPARQNQ